MRSSRSPSQVTRSRLPPDRVCDLRVVRGSGLWQAEEEGAAAKALASRPPLTVSVWVGAGDGWARESSYAEDEQG